MRSRPPNSDSTNRIRAPSTRLIANAAVPANAQRTAVLVSASVEVEKRGPIGAARAQSTSGIPHITAITSGPRSATSFTMASRP